MLSEKVHKAILFSEKAHRKQTRKGSNVPYIVHPLSVAFIVGKLQVDDDVVISALLHDTVEDCETPLSEIKDIFGERVATLVDEVTEKGEGWEERKKSVFDKISGMSKDALLIKSADMIHNISDLIVDIKERGDAAFDKFAVPKEEKMTQCKNVLKEIRRVWPENPLLLELEEKMSCLG